jgi:glycosyltransferase involved in cell wall biosynthesis
VREVAGDGAVLVDPEDVLAIRAAVSSLLADPQRVLTLRERGLANAKRFHPRVAAAEWADAYRLLASQTGRAPS